MFKCNKCFWRKATDDKECGKVCFNIASPNFSTCVSENASCEQWENAKMVQVANRKSVL